MMIKCPRCGSDNTVKNGTYYNKKTGELQQEIRCRACSKYSRIPMSHLQNKPEPESNKIQKESVKKVMAPAVGITELEFRSKHDNKFILTAKANGLVEGRLIPEPQFIEMCHVRQNSGYKGILGLPEFDRFRGRAGGTYYWSHPKTIKKLKDEGLLS